MKFALKSIFTLLLISFFISACGGDAATAQPNVVDEILTASVGTMVYSFFETQTALYTPETATPVSTPTLFPTLTPFSSATFPPPPLLLQPSPTFYYFTPTLGVLTPAAPTTTGTPATATVNPNALASGCNNLAFIRDVTIPAGTILQKKEEFTKTWKVQNTGTCNWMYQYRLVLLSGDSFGASGEKIQKLVTVGDWSEISLQMTAPKTAGTYTSYWRLADADGNMFGATLAVSFVVSD